MEGIQIGSVPCEDSAVRHKTNREYLTGLAQELCVNFRDLTGSTAQLVVPGRINGIDGLRLWGIVLGMGVLLQDEVLQLVCRAQQEGGRLPVAGDQLTHGCDLRLAELCRCPAPSSTSAAPPTQAVVGGG
ncbi:hypothetical protein EYF80_002132 [Liparis tanakae]|uniref:Uncharacterized protein n=1 Tax=Liparis tanakae TaxID=230148 RepID=A0A4Z2JBT8_9TELE|nr:hypothetical protein EYF80_002132 [Liparis tanakae]